MRFPTQTSFASRANHHFRPGSSGARCIARYRAWRVEIPSDLDIAPASTEPVLKLHSMPIAAAPENEAEPAALCIDAGWLKSSRSTARRAKAKARRPQMATTKRHYNLGLAYKDMDLFEDRSRIFRWPRISRRRQTARTLPAMLQPAGDIVSCKRSARSGRQMVAKV